MKASDLVRPEACQHVVPDQRSVLNPPKDPRGTRGSKGKGGLRNSTASCQRLPFPDDFSHSGKAWLGGASPWECPATPRSWKRPFQVPRLLPSILLFCHTTGPPALSRCGLTLGPASPPPPPRGTSHCFCSSSVVPSRTPPRRPA